MAVNGQQDNCVAIIGMGCIFPKANGLEEYWQLLFNGQDAITDIPEKTHFAIKDYFDKDPKCADHIYCKRGGFIPAVAFDPSKYGIPPNNINATDTSQLLGLVVAEMALKDAGYDVRNNFPNRKRTNIILGVTGTQELVIPLGARLGHPIWKNALKNSGIDQKKSDEVIKRIQDGYPEWQENSFPGLLGNVVAGRIANKLDLGGTNNVVDAACASSLSAINNAVMELIQGKCDMSITGGVDALNDIFMHMCFSQTGVLSHTSDARPFSKDSDGTVLGEGVGMIVLKRLADAEKDKDRIYAVIKGIGTSSDGNSGGIYAPDVAGQQRALQAAYKEASVDPSTIESIEAHGTGTRVGDKIEFEALKNFHNSNLSNASKQNPDSQKCALGSVKSMIGHAKAAAGIAGLIKIALSLYHKTHFPTLKADTPDPELDINNSPFYLNSYSKPWLQKTNNSKNIHPRRAGVSAFGFGGSNFHAVLEEYNTSKNHVSWNKAVQILAFSSNTIKELSEDLAGFINELQNDDKLDSKGKRELLAWHASQSRNTFSCQDELRVLIVIENDIDPVELVTKAISAINEDINNAQLPLGDPNIYFEQGYKADSDENCKVGFLFPGQGSQYTMMGKDLVSIFPEASDALALADNYFKAGHALPEEKNSPNPLHEYIYPMPEHAQSLKDSENALRCTDVAQPALGAISLGMLKILKRFALVPSATCGHSFGELSALNAANRISDKDFLKLSVSRGRHMALASQKSGDTGSMFAVKASMDKIEKLIADNSLDLVLANRNSYNQGVLSGSTKEIDKAITIFKQNKIRGIKLPVAAAFHSSLVKNAAKPFADDLVEMKFVKTNIPVMSNTKGTQYPSDNTKAKEILGEQLSNPVNFIENIESMYEKGISIFLEIGPKTVLTGLVKSILKDKNITALAMDASSSRKSTPDSGLSDLAHVLAKLASKGCKVDLTKWENPCEKIEEKKMNVFLFGANPKPVGKYNLPPSKAVDYNQKITPEPNQGKKMDINKISNKKDIPAKNYEVPQINSEAIELIQKGFESMQKLQSQTAKTHEKFLETQAQASKTLQSMMEQTRLFANIPQKPVDLNRTISEPIISTPEENQSTFIPESVTPDSMDHNVIEQQIPALANIEKSTSGPNDTEKLVFEIVSKLTGFPEEMLELDMDIESDLGIDSIKRVEIISELEKSLPDVSSLTPDTMGALRTLKEICDTINKNDANIDSDSGHIEQVNIPVENACNPSNSMDILIKTISDLTGFPEEMLEGDMDLESDLGVDSIKRVEILSTLEKELPEIGTLSSDEIAGFKTISEISTFLDKSLKKDSNTAQVDNDTEKKTLRPEQINDAALITQKLSRQVPFLEQQPIDKIKFYNGSRISISPGKKVYLTDDSSGIAACFKNEFIKQGINAEIINLGTETPVLHDAAGLVLIPDLTDKMEFGKTEIFLKNSFKLVKKNAKYLVESASEKSAFFATISFLGGGFGFDNPEQIINPLQGGLAGLSKTASLEWKDVLCKALDMPCSIDEVIDNAENAVTLMMTHGSVELGLSNGLCNIPKLRTQNIAELSQSNFDDSFISKDDVFIISGGAKGVTSECALEISKSFAPKIILLGRSGAPVDEPEWLQNTSSESDIKKLTLKHLFAGKSVKPVDLEKAYKQLMSNREIKENIEKLSQTGSIVEYFSCDITDKDQVTNIFSIVRKKHGSITGIIHGAGILEDKLIIEKNYEKFCNVFDTKVLGLNSLLEASKEDNLKYFIVFSSIAARTGNLGQSDYAMANEVLNKTLQSLSVSNPKCKFLAMNWGPWDGGMVNESLKKEFKKRKVDLIDKRAGALQLLDEINAKDEKDVEIIIGASLFGQEKPLKSSFTKAFSFELNKLSAPVLESHRINSNMVLPFAVHMEWIAHASEKNNPGLTFAGVDQMRLLKGISFSEKSLADSKSKSVEVIVESDKCKKSDHGFETEVKISSTKKEEKSFLNSVGIALLQNGLPEPPVLSASSSLDLTPYDLSVDEIYKSILFHGQDLHAIKSITGCSQKGIEITTTKAPSPDSWFQNPPARNWVFDPRLLDAAFQAAILWTWENKKQVCLPSYIANFRIYNSFKKHKGDIRIRFTVNETSSHKTRGYFTFLDDDNTIIASITGFEAVNDTSLIKKFTQSQELITRAEILEFAQGKPSRAFGEQYKIFDKDRQMARLPRPPYFFMDRVTKIDHTQWKMEQGGWIEAEYDIPENAWYFNANHSDEMPFCILLEIALQPCGWLAAWAGSALQSNDRLYFRNLGGKAEIHKAINRKTGSVKMRTRMTGVSQAGGMIIQDFDIEVLKNKELLYKGSTNFGFFTKQSLSNQIGLKNNQFHTYAINSELRDKSKEITFKANAPLTPDDLNIDENSGMPSTALRMLDKIDAFSFQGGLYNNGYVLASKIVNPKEWFFNAHFYQDPVCPGSLGVESFLQLLKYYALQKWKFNPFDSTIVETENTSHEWKYRGQIIPSNKKIEICAHIKQIIEGDQPQIIADGALSVDEICIYEMADFSVKLTDIKSLKLKNRTAQVKADQ